MKWKRCFHKLSAENFIDVQQELQEVLSQSTDGYKNWERFQREDGNTGWMHVDKDTAIAITKKPNFSEWLKQHKIYPTGYSVVVVNEYIKPVDQHIDRGPNAKINVPVLNNDFWHNRWFDDSGTCIAETDLNSPIVFNSHVKHDVTYKGNIHSNTNYPRIVLAITMKNDELWEQKYLID